MVGNLEPEERLMRPADWIEDLNRALTNLGWTADDQIKVKIGGTQVSGIDVGEDYNPKWSSPKGTRKYNKDAFIVIEAVNRNPVVPSRPNPDLKAHHVE